MTLEQLQRAVRYQHELVNKAEDMLSEVIQELDKMDAAIQEQADTPRVSGIVQTIKDAIPFHDKDAALLIIREVKEYFAL